MPIEFAIRDYLISHGITQAFINGLNARNQAIQPPTPAEPVRPGV